jgi:hypothetical protein
MLIFSSNLVKDAAIEAVWSDLSEYQLPVVVSERSKFEIERIGVCGWSYGARFFVRPNTHIAAPTGCRNLSAFAGRGFYRDFLWKIPAPQNVVPVPPCSYWVRLFLSPGRRAPRGQKQHRRCPSHRYPHFWHFGQ